MSRNERGFLRWYRVMPMLAVLITLAICLGLDRGPVTLARTFLYPVSYADQVQGSADRHGVDARLVCAVIKCESGWDSDARSSAGAVGLMQVMPSTADSLAEMGVVDDSVWDPDNLSDPATNIEYGSAYLAYLQENFSSTDEVVAAYNAGIGTVNQWLSEGGSISDSIDYPETSQYLERVDRAYEGYVRCYPDGITA